MNTLALAAEPVETMSEQQPARAAWATRDPLLTEYYDHEWGVPVTDETGVFERLTLEAFQSGLSWLTVLRKREAMREAFRGFAPEIVAEFTASDRERLLADERIIRNARKIDATIVNAQLTMQMRNEGKTLAEVVWSYRPERTPVPMTESEVPTTSVEAVALAKDLKKRGFLYVGPTTMYALMGAIGVVDLHLVGSHRRGVSGLWNADGSRAVLT